MNLEYKGINVKYNDYGQGNAVILLHGFLENSTIWNPFLEKLSKNNRIVIVDLLGHGETGCIGYHHSMEMMAKAVNAVLISLNIKSCKLVGHSMGGYVTLAFAEKYPDKTKGIFLVNSTASADSEERQKNRERAINAVKHDHKTFIRMAIANLFNPETKPKHQKSIEALTYEALKTPLQGIIAALEGMKIRKSRIQLLKNYDGIKWMIISKKDPVFGYEELLAAAKQTEVDIREFPDGHMSFIENKLQFLKDIMHFIEKL